MRNLLLTGLCILLHLPLYAQLRPVAGEEVHIDSKDPVTTFFYDKDKRSGEVTGNTFTVPPNTVMLHVVTATSNEMYPVYANGKVVPFAYYRMAELVSGAPLDAGRMKADITRQIDYMQREFAVNPAAEAHFRQKYFNMLANSSEPSHKSLLIQKLKAYHTDDEMELTMAQRYLSYLGAQQAADSIAALLRSTFPAGTFVKEERVQAIGQEKNIIAKTNLYKAFIQQFPPTEDWLYATLYEHMGMALLPSPQADGYFRLIPQPRDRTAAYNKAAIATRQISWAQKAVRSTDTTQRMAGWEAFQTLASLLYDQKDHDNALRYAAPAYAHTKSKESTTLYVQILIALHRLQEAQSVLEEALRGGNASVKMKELYASLGHTFVEKKKDSVKVTLLREPVSNITLKDVSGKALSIGDLKGKIVVLDFWATWCKPCIASFPAMQQVMKRFPNVVFLYIATFDAQAAVERFVKENAYPFRYMLDEALTGKQFRAYNHFKATGVPYKLVIDQEGWIRYRSGGFEGNDDALIDELSAVIGALQ